MSGVAAALLVLGTASAQAPQFSVDYTVKVASTADHLFHITADFKNIDQPTLDLSLPTWTPGWYTIENYAKNILRFRITDSAGKSLPLGMTRKQTWRVDTRGLKEIKAEFDYDAEILALNQAKITDTFAFFTGTQLFLLPEGHRSRPSVVRFDVPNGWKIASGLDETTDPTVFTAPDYDTLVDSRLQGFRLSSARDGPCALRRRDCRNVRGDQSRGCRRSLRPRGHPVRGT